MRRPGLGLGRESESFLSSQSHKPFESECSTCHEMAPDKLENGIQCCFNKFDCRLFISKFSQFACYLSLLQPVISKSLSQPFCKSCSLSVSIVLNVRFTTNGMCVMNNTRVARTNKIKLARRGIFIVPWYHSAKVCALAALPFQSQQSGALNHNKVVHQHVKMVPGTTFTKRTCNRCGLLKKRGMLLQPLH